MSGSIIVQKSTSSYWSRLVSSYLAQDSSDASNDDYSSDKSEELTRDVKHQLPPTSLPVSQPLRLGDLEADHGNRSLACMASKGVGDYFNARREEATTIATLESRISTIASVDPVCSRLDS
jgi:hypothetical protein